MPPYLSNLLKKNIQLYATSVDGIVLTEKLKYFQLSKMTEEKFKLKPGEWTNIQFLAFHIN